MWWWWLFRCVWGFWENVRRFIPRLPFFLFFFKVAIRSHKLIPLFWPGSVHSGSANWDDCGLFIYLFLVFVLFLVLIRYSFGSAARGQSSANSSLASDEESDPGRAEQDAQKYKHRYKLMKLERERCQDQLSKKEAAINSMEARLMEQEKEIRKLTEQNRRLLVSAVDMNSVVVERQLQRNMLVNNVGTGLALIMLWWKISLLENLSLSEIWQNRRGGEKTVASSSVHKQSGCW